MKQSFRDKFNKKYPDIQNIIGDKKNNNFAFVNDWIKENSSKLTEKQNQDLIKMGVR